MRRGNRQKTESRVRELERQMQATPIMSLGGGSSASPIVLYMGDGNTLYDESGWTVLGLKSVSASITAVPSLVPSALTGNTLTEGLAVARRYVGSSFTLVWVSCRVNDGTTTFSDLRSDIPESTWFTALTSIEIPITGGGGDTAPVWLPTLDGIANGYP